MSASGDDCSSMSDALAVMAGGERTFSPSEQLHFAACLRCRVEHGRYRRLMEAMRSLRFSPVDGDSQLESEILGRLDLHERWSKRMRSRVVATLGAAAAGAAATVGVIAAARYRRLARLVA